MIQATVKFLEKGVFGICSEKTYRGIMVAVKQFKENVHLSLAKHEASVLAEMEHPGNYQYSSQEWQTAVLSCCWRAILMIYFPAVV